MRHKTRADELAVFGGPPAFVEALHVGRPNLPDRGRFLESVGRILDRNLLTNDGPEVRALEAAFCQLTGAAHAVAVSNATIGLQLVAQALGLRGRVLMPAFTFVATAHAFKWLGLDPVFCDIDPATHHIDPAQVARRLGPDIVAVVGVHLWGGLCDPLGLEKLCRERDIPLIFDAAHALGCSGFGRAAGTFGTAEVFSLHATKICHSFEGGVVTTNDEALATQLRKMRNFGFVDYDRVDGLGINAKLPEVSAAMGLASLAELESYRDINRRNADRYRARLAPVKGLQLRPAPAGQRSNHQYVVAELDAGLPGGTRDVLYRALRAEGVLARRYFYPGCHRTPPYGNLAQPPTPMLGHTESLCERVLCFPNGIAVSPAAIDGICALTELILAHLPAVSQLLATRS